jgi:hypothetical protein
VTAEIKWEAASSPTPTAPGEQSAPPPADVAHAEAMPPEARAEFGSTAQTPDASVPVSATSAPTGPLFPHLYGPLNLDAIIDIRRAVRASDGTFTRLVLLDPTAPQGINLKKPSELARELVDATGEFSDALARYKDKIEAHMDELDKNIKGKLG